MAQDINRILDSLSDLASDANDLASNKELANLIDKLDDLADQSAAFGGEISRVLPTKIRAQADALKNLFTQVQSVAKTAGSELNNLVEFVDTIPVGQLRKKGLSVTSMASPTTASNPTAMPNVEPQESNEPKSEMLKQRESLWSSLKTNFRGSERPSNGFDFNRIRESVDGLNIDFGIIDPNAENQQSLFESIQASLPKGAGDLDSKPDPRDKEYEEYAEAMEGVLPDGADPELSKMNEAMYTSAPSVAAPIQTYSFADNAAANIDFNNLELDESDGFSFAPDVSEDTEHLTESTNPVQHTAKSYDISDDELASKIVD